MWAARKKGGEEMDQEVNFYRFFNYFLHWNIDEKSWFALFFHKWKDSQINITSKNFNVVKHNFVHITWVWSGLYMIGYGTRKIILKLPPFLITNAFFNYERGTPRVGKFKTSNENKNVFAFIWFWISRSWIPRSVIQKGGNFKIFFLFRTLSYLTLGHPNWTVVFQFGRNHKKKINFYEVEKR